MVHVSKQPLDEKVQKRLAQDFVELLSYPKTKLARKKLIEQFFTPTEQMLFAKRIAIILMIDAGVSFNDIERNLSVSSSTVEKYRSNVREKNFKSITTALKHIYKKNTLIDFLAVMFATRRGKRLARKECYEFAESIGAEYGFY